MLKQQSLNVSFIIILILFVLLILVSYFAIIVIRPNTPGIVRSQAYNGEKADNNYDSTRYTHQEEASVTSKTGFTQEAISGEMLGNSTQTLTSDKQLKSKKKLSVQAIDVLSINSDSVKQSLSHLFKITAGYKQRLTVTMGSSLPSPQAELVTGMIFGGSSQLPSDIKHKIKLIGLAHVVSASGYNVSLMMSITWTVFGRFWPRKTAGLGVGVCLFLYIIVAGATASLVRATIMGLLSLLAVNYCHRQYRAGWGLLISVVLMLLLNPSFITEISFQLSVAASAGIIFFASIFTTNVGIFSSLSSEQVVLGDHRKQGGLKQGIVQELKDSWWLCISAQLLTLPLILFHFGECSLLSFIANPLLLWLTPLITVSGLCLLVSAEAASVFLPFEATSMVLGIVTGALSTGFLAGVSLLSQGERGFIEGLSLSSTNLMAWFFLAGLLRVMIWNRGKQKPKLGRLFFDGELK